IIDQRKQLLSRLGVAFLYAFEDARDLGHKGRLTDADRMSIAEKKTQRPNRRRRQAFVFGHSHARRMARRAKQNCGVTAFSAQWHGHPARANRATSRRADARAT